MMADLCHVVRVCFRGENAKGRHANKGHISHLVCFCLANFWPARSMEKAHNILMSSFCLTFVMFSHGGAKGRHTNTKLATLVPFCMMTLKTVKMPSHNKKKRHISYVVCFLLAATFSQVAQNYDRCIAKTSHIQVSCFCLLFVLLCILQCGAIGHHT